MVGEGSGPSGPGVEDDRSAEPPAVATLDLDSGEWETSESPIVLAVAGTAPVAGGTVVFIDGSYVLLGGDGRWSEPQPLPGAIPSDVLSDGTVAIALVRSGGGDPPARVTVVVG